MWSLLEPLLPERQTRGRYYHDHRTILNGMLYWMLYWMHTGVPWRDLPWRDLPERYGPKPVTLRCWAAGLVH